VTLHRIRKRGQDAVRVHSLLRNMPDLA
jgi:hypothetical protein